MLIFADKKHNFNRLMLHCNANNKSIISWVNNHVILENKIIIKLGLSFSFGTTLSIVLISWVVVVVVVVVMMMVVVVISLDLME